MERGGGRQKIHAWPGKPPAKAYVAIMLAFLPPNMTAWLQPLDLVVCGLIKTVQRARRGRHLARHLKTWKKTQDEILGAALLANKPPPPLQPWRPPNPTLMEGIFCYQQTDKGELQEAAEQTTKDATVSRRRFKTRLVSLHLRMENGKNMWSLHFLPRPRGSPAASHILHEVHKLQQKHAISAYGTANSLSRPIGVV